MTTIVNTGIPVYQWLVIVKALELELKMRPSSMRSRRLKQAWPGIRMQLGLPPGKMSEAALRTTIVAARAKLAEAETNLKEGDITE